MGQTRSLEGQKEMSNTLHWLLCRGENTYSCLWTLCWQAESTLLSRLHPETWWNRIIQWEVKAYSKCREQRRPNQRTKGRINAETMKKWTSDLLSCCSPLIMGFTMPLSISSFPELCTREQKCSVLLFKRKMSLFIVIYSFEPRLNVHNYIPSYQMSKLQ